MNELMPIINGFMLDGEALDAKKHGSGHINDTYLVTLKKNDGTVGHVLMQRMNKRVFKKPIEVMENIMNVTSYLQERIIEKGGDPNRETMSVICSKE